VRVSFALPFLLVATGGFNPAAAQSCPNVLPPPDLGICSFSAGDAGLLLAGDVLTPENVLEAGQVLIDADGTIACVGCDCSASPGFDTARQLLCPGVVISPGLINAHDHVAFNDNPPVDHGTERYEHRHQWREGQDGHTEISATNNTVSTVWSELRGVLSGVTSVIGSGGTAGLQRNLDRGTLLEGLTPPESIDYDSFPLNDTSGARYETGCNNYPDLPAPSLSERLHMHVAEGIDDTAQNEFDCIADEAAGGNALPGAAIVHGLTLDAEDGAAMLRQGASLVWSPRHQLSLYGVTAPVTLLDIQGVPIGLGTSWTPTGSFNLQRELACAAQFSETHLNDWFDDKALFDMVTANAGELAGRGGEIGRLAVGLQADITLFDHPVETGYAAVTRADSEHVALVLRGGTPQYGRRALMDALGVSASLCEVVDVCGQSTRVCAEQETGAPIPFATFDSELFICDGVQADERACQPGRTSPIWPLVFDGIPDAADTDGDGVEDLDDNCPLVFNPPLPRGDQTQDDTDGDGIGDACDGAPRRFSPASTVFTDGFESAFPVGGNIDSTGAVAGLVMTLNDGEQTLFASSTGAFQFPEALSGGAAYEVTVLVQPPGLECSLVNGTGVIAPDSPITVTVDCVEAVKTIYEIKTGAVADGAAVVIDNILVTYCAPGYGYFVQTVPGDAAYQGIDNSAVQVFDSNVNCGTDVAAGNRLDMHLARVRSFFGLTRLTDVVFTVTSTGNAVPAPIVSTPAQLDGNAPGPLDAQLVTVENVTVTSLIGGAFIVDSTLRIGDTLHTVGPAVSDEFSSISGMMSYGFGATELLPRTAADVVAP